MYQSNIASQVNFTPLKETTDFIHSSKSGITFLSSINGLYSFNGIDPPERINFPGLENKNVQSNLFQDIGSKVWFTTYNRIVCYDYLKNKHSEYPLILTNNDTLEGDYHAFSLDTTARILLVKQKSRIFAFNLINQKTTEVCDSIDGYRMFRYKMGEDTYYFSNFHAPNPSILKVNQSPENYSKLSHWKNWPKGTMAMDIVKFNNNQLLIGTTMGLFLGDISSATILPLLTDKKINGILAISELEENSWIVSTRDTLVHLLVYNGKEFKLQKFPYAGIDHLIHRIHRSPDKIIFLSSYENGIYYFNPDKVRFTDWNKNSFDEIENTSYSADRLKNYDNGSNITASGRPYVFNSDYEIWCNAGYRTSKVVFAGKSSVISNPDSSYLFRYYQPENNRLYGNFGKNGLFEYKNGTWEKTRYPEKLGWEFNYYYPVNDSISLASINMSKLVLWNVNKPDEILWETKFTGDIHNQFFQGDSNQLFLATEQGLAKLDFDNYQITLIKDKHESSCLCILPDQSGKLWYSSLSGITQYNPALQLHRYFYPSDGASLEKYAERKCLALAPDSLLFFHSKGATLVVPSHVKSLNTPAKVFISSLKINDLDYAEGDTLNYCSNFNLSYSDNTLSFEISAIDWSDPAHTNLRYMLNGYDEAWVQPNRNNVFVRYANLPPGHYRMIVQGANSDEIWNTDIEEIAIRVMPPFWLTWWFLTLSVLTAGGIIYYALRSYYQRKLEKKNQLLREQSLIIEKQQAVENERTRIASEMHDDLGSGLTTIRYLSDKALKQAKDADEAIQIKRIADHSNTLVRNMSEIIWAMNSRFDNTENLIGYLRRYASEYLDERQMPFTFEANGATELVSIGGEKRRNIFLIFKELLHNSIKYSKAKSISILIETTDNFSFRISEIGGVGFDPDLSIERGNGLFNIQKRLKSIDGHIAFDKTDDAMHIIVTVPINVTNLA